MKHTEYIRERILMKRNCWVRITLLGFTMLVALFAIIMLGSLSQAQEEAIADQPRTLVSIRLSGIRVIQPFEGTISFSLQEEGQEAQRDRVKVSAAPGEILTHESSFNIVGNQFGWSVEVFDQEEKRILLLKGVADTQLRQAWYTEIQFPGRDKLDLSSDTQGLVFIRVSVLEAQLQFASQWKIDRPEALLVSFNMDNGRDKSVVEAILSGGLLQAKSKPLLSTQKVADFEINVTDKANQSFVEVKGKVDFEKNKWQAQAWFDKERVKLVMVRPIFKASALSVYLPGLASIAQEGQGLQIPEWQEGGAMIFYEPGSEEQTSPEQSAADKDSSTDLTPQRNKLEDFRNVLEKFLQSNYVGWVIFSLLGFLIVTVAFVFVRARKI